jgi:hypothetical protein
MFCSIEADRLQSAEWKARKKAYQEEMARWQKHLQPGQAKRTRSERIQQKGAGEEPVWDPFPGMRISLASQAFRLWEGCVRPDRLSFEQLASQLQGLVIGTPDTKAVKPGGLRLVGVNRTIRFDLSPPTRPRPNNLSTPKWCSGVVHDLLRDGKGVTTITTDGSSKEVEDRGADQWDARKSKKVGQGAILMFQRNPTKQGEQTTPAAIIIKNFPPDVGVNSNYVELITQAAAHQIAYAIEATPRVETDCQGNLKHAQKELTKGSQRSMETQTMAPCYRVIRKVARARRRLRRSHTKAHPEDKGRKCSSFTAKKARIYAADIWADPGKERNSVALSERAMEEGLKHNIVPETVYYVHANEVMEGLFEPGDHY